MLPDFEENGYLPPGIHRCPVEEVVNRFGQGSPEREVETSELVEFVAWARQAGIRRLVVDGSYVTTEPEPIDMDVVILPGLEQPQQGEVALDSAHARPFLDIKVATDELDFERWALTDFGSDRKDVPRGVVEIEL